MDNDGVKLYEAVRRGNAEQVIHITNGESTMETLNWDGQRGGALLRLAIDGGHDLIARILIYGGAHVRGLTPPASLPAVADLIRRRRTQYEPSMGYIAILTIAALEGDCEIVSLLLKLGADKDHTEACGDTALCAAVTSGQLDVARILIHAGADVNKQGLDGECPLYLASQEGKLEMVTLLLDAGASVNLRDNCGWTPLCVAVNEDHPEIVETLLRAGADPDNWPYQEMPPLWQAATRNNIRIAELLLNSGADPDFAQGGYETPLMAAIKAGNAKLAGILLNHGADPAGEYHAIVSNHGPRVFTSHLDVLDFLMSGKGDPTIALGCIGGRNAIEWTTTTKAAVYELLKWLPSVSRTSQGRNVCDDVETGTVFIE